MNTPHSFPRPAGRRAARGFTLVEVLVALGLGVLILLALTILFSRNTGNHAELERNTRQLESARYAIDLLAEDVMHAGYFGEFDPNGLTDAAPPTAVWTNKNPPSPPHPDPCAVAVNAQGWDTTVVPAQIPVPVQGIGAAAAVGCLANRVAGTEALVVRHAETGAPLTLAAATNNNLYIQISRCDADPAPRISAANGGSASFDLHLPPPAGTTGCGAVNASLRRLSQRTYFVASCNDCGANDGIPTLKRVEMIDGALRTMSVAEGVENLQIEYGIDTDTDGVPNNFVTTAGVTEVGLNLWENIVSVRLHLLTRSSQSTPGFSDTRTYQLGPDVAVATPADGNKRTLMTTTVRLNNVGGRRE